jgi:hypothetical protein
MDLPIRSFRYQRIPAETLPLRQRVRAFLAGALKDRPPLRRGDSWLGADPAFSRELGRRGWWA